MYKFKDKQISFSDFGQPVGMTMSAENRWVKKADSIPWGEIEKRYAQLFRNRNGNVAKPLRLALGACIIQAEYGFSDVETTLMIQEHPYLQYFCGFAEYKDKPPFDSSLMVYFRKRLTPEILGEINELIIKRAIEEQAKTLENNNEDNDNGDSDDDQNSGTLIVDATCAPSNISYPTDTKLLDEARRNSEKIIDALHEKGVDEKPRTYRRKAKKEYQQFVRIRRPNSKKIRKQIKKQLGYLKRNLNTIDKMLQEGKLLPPRFEERLQTLQAVYHQQEQMLVQKTHSVENRIVSFTQPYLRPIVRGKAKSPVEFGAKLDISVVNGYARLETFSFDAYNEATFLIQTIERYKEREGKYPKRVLADKIYRNRNNLNYCKQHGIRLSGPALGRPKKDEVVDKKQDYTDICERVEVERNIGLAKQKCGLGLIRAKLQNTTASVIALSIVVLNLRKIQSAFAPQFWLFVFERLRGCHWKFCGVVQ